MIAWVGLYQISDAIQGTLIGVLRGMQDVKIIAGLSFVAYVLLNIPVGYLCAFTFGLGSTGLLVGYVVGLSTAAVAYAVRVYRNLRGQKIAQIVA
jgi:MATE family multidrug resistance protein